MNKWIMGEGMIRACGVQGTIREISLEIYYNMLYIVALWNLFKTRFGYL